MVKLRAISDVGDGDITKELHRTIQFSNPGRGVKPDGCNKKIWSWDSIKNLELGL